MTVRATKMHGLGNDYIYVDAFQQRVADPARLARAVSDRHTGVEATGRERPHRRAGKRPLATEEAGRARHVEVEAFRRGRRARLLAARRQWHRLDAHQGRKSPAGAGQLAKRLRIGGGVVGIDLGGMASL